MTSSPARELLSLADLPTVEEFSSLFVHSEAYTSSDSIEVSAPAVFECDTLDCCELTGCSTCASCASCHTA